MIFCGSIYLRTFQCYGVFAACVYVICTTADLQGLCASYVYLTYMQVGLRDRLTLFYLSLIHI